MHYRDPLQRDPHFHLETVRRDEFACAAKVNESVRIFVGKHQIFLRIFQMETTFLPG